MRRISTLLLLAGLSLLFAGCAGIPLAGVIAGGEVASVVNTDKTLTDHVASNLTGRDCSTLLVKTRGEYCVDPNSIPAPAPPVYCYRSLGDITCYSEQDPYGNGSQPVNPGKQ